MSFGSTALFKWKGKSCPDSDVNSCYLGHGDILVMDGQCQDEFLHCTDPGLEQERINVTFRWIRQHTTSCHLRAGVVCCLPTCAQGFSIPVMENGGLAPFGFCGVPWGPVCMGDTGSAGLFPHPHRARATEVCFSLDTLFGRRSAGEHFFRNSWRVSWITQKKCFYVFLGVERLREINAENASLGGTAQSPWP